jgi:two-component system sensor histidine kinase GlrK
VRLSLFARLILGYLAIFVIVAAASLYAIVVLRQFGERTAAIFKVDNRVLDHEKALADLLLGQSRAEQQFVVTRDEAWYLQFIRLKIDFEGRLESASALSDGMAEPILKRIHRDYLRYTALVEDESRYVRTNKKYPQAKYKEGKETLIDAMLSGFERLRVNQQHTTSAKLADLAAMADQAREMSIVIAVSCLLAIVLMSLLVTRSITAPIALLKRKTEEIAKGNFDSGVVVKSPPEIGALAEALSTMAEKLRELDRMKADFFASMSHELRTPLTSIKEGTGLLLEGVGGATTEKQRKLLAILAEESNRLISLVNSLLDLSKMEAGMMTYEFEIGSLDPLIKRAVAEIAPLVEAKQIKLESTVALPLPATRIDPERILQVLRNLLGNAVKFTPAGGHVTVTAKPLEGKLEIAVRDSGPGIPAESLISIFEKFNQVGRPSNNARSGTGLGLAIVKSIVSSHGGQIWAESQIGQGSAFIFVLPC